MVVILLLIHVAQAALLLMNLPEAAEEEDRVQKVPMEDPGVVLENSLLPVDMVQEIHLL